VAYFFGHPVNLNLIRNAATKQHAVVNIQLNVGTCPA